MTLPEVSRRRSTLFNLIGSGLNMLIVSLQGVILIPAYLQAVGPQLYGAWLGAAEMLLWMQVLDVGIQGLMIQRVGNAHGQRDLDAVGAHFATGMAMIGSIAVLAACLGLALSFPLPTWLRLVGEDAIQLRACFQAGVLATACIILSNSAAGLARGVQSTALMNVAVVAATLVGFATSVGLLVTGWGLWSIPMGMAARATVSVAVNLVFVVHACRSGFCGRLHVRRELAKEYLLLLPMSVLGGVGYSLMNHSEALLVGICLTSELAPVLALTRKAADIIRSCVDMIGNCSFGSFAHLAGSPQRHRVLQVHAEISGLWISLALAGAVAYMTVNPSLISVWVGEHCYGGHLLTILVALQLVVAGGAYLMNFLYRACGQVQQSVLALLLESLFRFPLMIGLLLWLGLPGLPLAAIVTSAVAGSVVFRLTRRNVSSFAEPAAAPGTTRVHLTRAVLFGLGILVCLTVLEPSWGFVLVAGGLVSVLSGILLVYTTPVLGNVRAPLALLARRLSGAGQQGNA